MARRAAVVEAQRNLLETVKDVAIDSETNVEMSMTLMILYIQKLVALSEVLE